MKSGVLYLCLTFAIVFFTFRIFAAAAPTPSSPYEQLITLYSTASKIADLESTQGIWKGKCYPRFPLHPTDGQDVEVFLKHWHWDPPKNSPLQPVDAFKFQIRPLSFDPMADWTSFLADAGNLGDFAEYAEEHVSPNTWGRLFSQPELRTATEADVKQNGGYLYVWIRAVHDGHWACYASLDSVP